ncbi:MAG: ABC transporter permease [Lachnospiraceae bacterium]
MRFVRKITVAKVMTVLVLIIMLVPILILIPVSLSSTTYIMFPITDFSTKWYVDLFTDPEWAEALKNSLLIAFFTTLASLVLGMLITVGLRELPFKLQVPAAEYFRLPQSVPIIVTAIAVFSLLTNWKLVGTMTGLVISHTLIAIPFVVTTLTAGLSRIGRSYEMAAQNLGAGVLRAFVGITLPQLAPSLFAGGLFAFLTSFDEIAVTLFVTSPAVSTLPMKMYNGINQSIKPTLAACSTILILLVILGFTISAVFQLKKTIKHK